MISLVRITFLTTSLLIQNPTWWTWGRHDAERVRQSPIPSDKYSAIIGSSDLMEEELVPHPEVWEDGIPQTRIPSSPWAERDYAGTPEVGGGGEMPDAPRTVEGIRTVLMAETERQEWGKPQGRRRRGGKGGRG